MKLKVVGALVTAGVLAAFIATVPVAGQQPEGGNGRGGRERAPAGPVPRMPDGKPDMRGHWNAPPLFNSNILEEHPGGFGIQAGKSVIIDPPDGKIPYQPWALAQRNENRKPENAYLDNEGRCYFSGIPRIMLFSFDVQYVPGAVVQFFDYVHHTRILSLTRREHLPSSVKLWMGDPIAHWDGDTLVVESTNFNGKAWFALGGDFMTENASIVERFTMTDANTLKWTATLTDPKAYTRPWTMTSALPFARGPEVEGLEDTCHEGNANLAHLKNNYDAAHPSAKK